MILTEDQRRGTVYLRWAGAEAFDTKGRLVPPWVFAPGERSRSGFWRFGDGDGYVLAWIEQWELLNHAERLAYQADYPPPRSCWRGWRRFYEYLWTPPDRFNPYR